MSRAEPWWPSEFGDYDAIRRETDRLAGRAHLDGTPWCTAPIPPPEHTCWAQSWQLHFADRYWIDRCPCGGWRHRPVDGSPGTPWTSINSRADQCAPSPSLIRRALHAMRRRGRTT